MRSLLELRLPTYTTKHRHQIWMVFSLWLLFFGGEGVTKKGGSFTRVRLH